MRKLVALFLCLLGTPALAQSDPGFVKGQVPTAAQWNSYFAGKLDYNNGNLVATSLTLGGGLVVGGNTTLSGSLTVNGAASIPALTGNYPYISLQALGIVLNSPSAAATNDAVILAAFNQANTAGGGWITAPCGNIYTSATIDNKYQHVMFAGCAASFNSNGGTNPAMTYGTVILPTTAVTALKHRTPYSATSAVFAGGGFANLTVNGNSIAPMLLEVDSVKRGTYTGLTFIDAVGGSGTYAVHFTSGVTGTDLADNAGVTGANINMVIRQLDGVAAQATGCVQFDGSTNANFNYNFDISITCISHTTSPNPAVDVAYADNNTFASLAIYNSPGTGPGLMMRCATPRGGDNNTFYHLFSNSGIVAEGTDTGGCSTPVYNVIWSLDAQGGVTLPTVGTGSNWTYFENTNNTLHGLLSPTFTGQLTVNNNTNIPNLGSSTGFAVVGADATNPNLDIVAYGDQGNFTMHRYNGTQASPTTLTNGTTIGCYGWGGYNGTSLTGLLGSVCALAVGTWTGSSEAMALEFKTVAASSTTPVLAMTIGNSGGLHVGSTFASPGVGNIEGEGTISATGGFIANAATGVDCSVGTLNPTTAIVSKGIITHC